MTMNEAAGYDSHELSMWQREVQHLWEHTHCLGSGTLLCLYLVSCSLNRLRVAVWSLQLCVCVCGGRISLFSSTHYYILPAWASFSLFFSRQKKTFSHPLYIKLSYMFSCSWNNMNLMCKQWRLQPYGCTHCAYLAIFFCRCPCVYTW